MVGPYPKLNGSCSLTSWWLKCADGTSGGGGVGTTGFQALTDDGLVFASRQVMMHFHGFRVPLGQFLVNREGKILQTMIVSELVEERTTPSAVSRLISSIHVLANAESLSLW